MAEDAKDDVKPPMLEERVLYLEKLVHSVAGLGPLDTVVAADRKAADKKAADEKAKAPEKAPVAAFVTPKAPSQAPGAAKTLGPQS